MVKIITKKDFMDYYKKQPARSSFEKRRANFYLDMYDNPLVDALYLHYIDNNEFIGECVLIFKDERSCYEFEYEKDILKKKSACLIKNLRIIENKQGLGYFSKFLNEIKQIAKTKNCKYLTFSVNKDNSHALAVYKHLKAHKFGEEHVYKDSGPMIFMQINIE